MMKRDKPRWCAWAHSELAIAYHDAQWGVPQHHDRALFELLILEGAQAGLSWESILKKRDNYRDAFFDFDAHRVARMSAPRHRTTSRKSEPEDKHRPQSGQGAVGRLQRKDLPPRH